MREFSMGDFVQTSKGDLGVIRATRAQQNARGRTEISYKIQMADNTERWVPLSEVTKNVGKTQRILKRPSKNRGRR